MYLFIVFHYIPHIYLYIYLETNVIIIVRIRGKKYNHLLIIWLCNKFLFLLKTYLQVFNSFFVKYISIFISIAIYLGSLLFYIHKTCSSIGLFDKYTSRRNSILWSPLNVITLVQDMTDYIIRMITLNESWKSNKTYVK